MVELSDFQEWQILGTSLTGTIVTETFLLLSVPKGTVPKVMTTCTQRSKTSSAKENNRRKEKPSVKEIDEY
ncbi:hypothetical protein TNCV_3519621 [Trichonephila clavipes]|uniref:Uncharacterized protein n=1 Tax=Trichonephila clavipes TaxID=2585209 RepID=A0A8X6SY30_TRICX|nr:hypothetical protein TNCV_3519621 [Trichonephila clavipes]